MRINVRKEVIKMELLKVNELRNNEKLLKEIEIFVNDNCMEDLPEVNKDLEIIYYSNAGELLNDYYTNIAFERTPIEELTKEMVKVNYDIDELMKTCFNDYMFKTNEKEFIELVVTDE